ncbi:acetyl-CoA decarbonylase/synthase complex subunit gamma [Clostridium luticellarii]|jgi:acetyl-CoA decarbonylase/synthase complex subunit gamma|uniref:Corrinoid/iron-sulfur protein large subunit n=1 Tax=Clostridium luticellarii TaxID=1691940 RepID=A0A2T0BSW4_9CLOT|nr:acetyl-CoA decarbonylase/synthase complex subunit gamma [Clostridium luticellarii]MCI1946186.1 acetyl-CoA decarbonylase/synthase complex subunit gamma [Clostridium luticellarii]MCI1969487.1 acetyl-CoA decarbonylase/synthase complex subunit gamma [Clostridium luticellarii]MCI1995454.1 acetyl-CoA decarbonylase/synthase complex subunit gamma [Clostridium luticellarii]MCI2040634.1 acetyl-CoA decarbonylase/synthase complex subunit gamma [Clostridium luticellarii]PRR86967.1 Corrinoid/iron-sulfur 
MALTGLGIFKLTPKKNCKDCGFPTCLAFSMKVASGAVEISKCPHMSKESVEKLAEATAPLMKTITLGKGDTEYKLGGETVLFRHEKTLVNRNRFAVLLSDDIEGSQIDAKIQHIKDVQYVRIGEDMKTEFVALKYVSNKDKYLELIKKVKSSGLKVGYILVCEDAAVMKEALQLVKDENPLAYGANKDNFKEMVDLVKQDNIALGVKAENLEELYNLVEEIQKLGYKNLVLDPGSKSVKQTFENAVQIRRINLQGQDRVFGYPSILFLNELANGDKFQEVTLSTLFTMKYGSILVLSDMDYVRALPLYGIRQNIFTDPQKPMRVEVGVYGINNPDDNSPVMCTVDFALTYFIVSGEIERSKMPVWMVIPDAGGYSVLTSWAAGKFTADVIAGAIKKSGVEEKTKSRTLIIPGKVAVLKGELEDSLPDWNITVGTTEAMYIPKFLKELAAK